MTSDNYGRRRLGPEGGLLSYKRTMPRRRGPFPTEQRQRKKTIQPTTHGRGEAVVERIEKEATTVTRLKKVGLNAAGGMVQSRKRRRDNDEAGPGPSKKGTNWL